MPDGTRLAPLDRIVLSTPLVTVGEWRCAPTDPRFRDSGPIERHLVAFPRTSVRIAHAGGRPFVADATRFTIYNRGQRYSRSAIDAAGDRCDWWAVSEDLARAIAAHVDPRSAGAAQPLRFAHGPADAALYCAQRAALLAMRAARPDPLAAEEVGIAIVAQALARAAHPAGAREHAPLSVAQRELAEAAAAVLGARFRERVDLAGLAAHLRVSPFHLCRVFRRHTGMPLHRRLTSLRVRAALEAVAERDGDLTAIALEHGFASHSHFTAAFRRELGRTPSAWRRAVRGHAGPARARAART